MAFLDLHTAQDSGDEGWFQINRVTGLNRLIWHPVQRHRSARVFEEDPVALVGGRTGGAEKTEENEGKRMFAWQRCWRWKDHKYEQI